MTMNHLPKLLGVLLCTGTVPILAAQSTELVPGAPDSLLSMPLELTDVETPPSVSEPGPSSMTVSTTGSESMELVGPPYLLLDPQPATQPVSEPVSRWAARPLPGSARAQTGDNELPISGDGIKDALQVGGGLAVVLAILWVLRALVRRSGGKSGALAVSGGRSPAGIASILARYPVARGQEVLLLGIGQRIIVVNQSAGSMQTLSEITDPDEVLALRAQINGTDRAHTERGFAAKLTQSLETKPEGPPLEPVAGMPGLVSETVDLTRKRRGRLSGGGR
ncbi:MAG: flagellar biosynthetic protein FliO [Planctomycetota bacterium]|nr:flagellar biosynthetic protein FliO [Planctomycetota bacterium]